MSVQTDAALFCLVQLSVIIDYLCCKSFVNLIQMKLFFTMFFAFAVFVSHANTTIKVVDNEDSSPVGYATVFGKTGCIIGMTDDNGFIVIQSDSDFPITIKCLGYESVGCDAPMPEVRLKHSLFELGEVVVTPVDRPVLRVLCYVREYVSGATSTDTLINFNEHMADFFLPTRDEIKGFKTSSSPRFLCSRLYSRMKNSSGLDSIFKPSHRDETFCWAGMVEMPSEVVAETEKIKNGAKLDTIPGKHGIKQLIRKTGESTYMIQADYLADSKKHKISPFIFKLLGMTIDFDELQGSWVYRCNEKGVYTAADVISGTFSLSVIGKGKWIKKAFKSSTPVRMYSFYEIYPVEVEYLSVDEANNLLNENPPRVEMTVSPAATPLDAAVRQMIDACPKQQP